MKKLLYLLPLSLLLTACPVGLYYAPGEIGTEKINPALEGTWEFTPTAHTTETEVMKVSIKKRDAHSFSVSVVTTGSMYSLKTTNFIGYESVINNIRILYLKPDDEDKYYCYQYKLIDSKNLEIADIPLLVGGIDAVKSTESLREEIKASSLKEDFKKEEINYKKVN